MKPPTKKAQLMAQPFIYIFALILGALILVWGGKVIYDLMSTAGQVEVGKFVKELENDAKEYFNYEAEASKPINLNQWLPKEIKYVCILGNEEYTPDFTKCRVKQADGKLVGCASVETLEPMFKAAVNAEAAKKDKGKNIFFLPSTAASMNKFTIAKLKPAGGNPLCYANGGKMIITSKVTYVEAS